MRQKHPEQPEPLLPQELLVLLEDVLHKIQKRIAVKRTNEQFALIRLVEGMSLEEWKNFAGSGALHDWLAVPLEDREIVPLHALRDMLQEMAHERDHDPLTGLANRRRFDRQISLELERAARAKLPISLVLLDIDNFKSINDTYGHALGDEVLANLGATLIRSLRAYDVAARVGGEELCLILPDTTTRQAFDLANRILAEFSRHLFTTANGTSFSVTFSAGVATAFPHIMSVSPQDLYTQADELMYTAKRQGKNRVEAHASLKKMADNPAMVQAVEKHFLFTGTGT